MNHASFIDHVPAVMERFAAGTPESVTPVVGGTLNWNFRVETTQGVYFLRRCRDDLETDRITGEHELLAWVAERDIPAPVPLAAQDGATLVDVMGGRWALFPWMPGAPVPRGALSSPQAVAAGEIHGRIHAVLAAHPDSRGAHMTMTWDRDESVALLSRLIETAEHSGAESWIVDGLHLQQEMLHGWDVKPPQAFGELPVQLLHGDFHDQQLLFEDEHVSAVVDWEIWHTDARAREVIRSLAFSKLLDSKKVAEYGAGYRRHVRLSGTELSLALDLWWQTRVVGMWAWAAYLLGGNQRVQDFFPEMIEELRRAQDDRWRAHIKERVLGAFCG